MKLHFEKVGRAKKTFDVDIDSSCTLEGLVEEYDFLRRQICGVVMSEPDFEVAEDGKSIYIFAGFHCIGKAWFVNGGAS